MATLTAMTSEHREQMDKRLRALHYCDVQKQGDYEVARSEK
jgi:hypothetical protein